MEILDKLPDELNWNVNKYLSHPTAALIKFETAEISRFGQAWYDATILITKYEEDGDVLQYDEFRFKPCMHYIWIQQSPYAPTRWCRW